jgi:hypothetical protein
MTCEDLPDLTACERLARAVLLFHAAPSWDEKEKREWHELTGQMDATTKVLCDLAREVRASFDALR